MHDADDLIRLDWIGREVKVISAKNREFFGIAGKVVDETRHLLFIRAGLRIIKIPKKGNVFELCWNNRKARVQGDVIEVAPEERLKLKV